MCQTLVHVVGRGHDSVRLGQGRVVHDPFDCLVIFLAGLAGVLQALPQDAVGVPQFFIFGFLFLEFCIGVIRPGLLALAAVLFTGQGRLQCLILGLGPFLGRPGFLLLGRQRPGMLPVLLVIHTHPAGLLVRFPARHVEDLGTNVLGLLHPDHVHVSHLAVLQVRVRQVDMVVVFRLPGLVVQVAFVAVQVPPHAADIQLLLQGLYNQLPDVHLFGGLGAVDHALAEQLHAVVDLTGTPAVFRVVDVFLPHLVAGQALAAFLVAARICVLGKLSDVLWLRVILGPLTFIVGLRWRRQRLLRSWN